jgi:hypothetical protein
MIICWDDGGEQDEASPMVSPSRDYLGGQR